MNPKRLLSLLSLLFLGASLATVTAATNPPNIIFFLADDLGYGDIGSYGQKKIHTPNLDRLAAEGMRFTQSYAGNAVCAPSRCVLMTGKHPGHAYVRDNKEVQPEGQAPLPADTVTLPKLLKANGYATGAFGKWGLGFPGSSGDPGKQGFDQFFGYNCQRQAHNYYPTNLWDNDRRVPLRNPDFSAHQKFPAGADTNSPASYARYSGKDYAPDLINEKSREFLRAHKDGPFFMFVPTTVPHLALQIPEDSLAEYAGQWPDPPYLGDHGFLPNRTPRATYAAMVTRMDREIGRLMDLVKELGLEENTIFIFASDNGPLYDQLGGTDTEFFNSNAGLRGRKGSLFEGGVRVPFIVRWKSHIKPGTTTDRVTGFEDCLPTFLELAGAKTATPKDIDGISFASTLLGGKQPPRPFLYREFPAYGGQQSIRVGDWVALRQNLTVNKKNPKADLQIQLYDLSTDPHQEHNIAQDHPDIVAKLGRRMRDQHTVSAEFPQPALDKLGAR